MRANLKESLDLTPLTADPGVPAFFGSRSFVSLGHHGRGRRSLISERTAELFVEETTTASTVRTWRVFE